LPVVASEGYRAAEVDPQEVARVSIRPVLMLLWFVLAAVAAPVASAQGLRYPMPERIERTAKADDQGMLQWEQWPAPKCISCSGTGKGKCTTCERFQDDSPNCIECKRNKDREVVCRVCAGVGTLPDPLDKVSCPGCMGATFLLCPTCGGGGRLKIGGANQWSDCPCCRGDGGFKCGVCNGARLVETAGLKPSLRDANVKDLGKAMAATDAALKELGVFNPAGGDKARKEQKALVKALEAGASAHPAIKRLPKVFDDYMGKCAAGSQFKGYEEEQVESMNLVKQNAEYYLKHQKRMLDLAMKRAEANAKLAAERKGK
jgi:hypothetical protein